MSASRQRTIRDALVTWIAGVTDFKTVTAGYTTAASVPVVAGQAQFPACQVVYGASPAENYTQRAMRSVEGLFGAWVLARTPDDCSDLCAAVASRIQVRTSDVFLGISGSARWLLDVEVVNREPFELPEDLRDGINRWLCEIRIHWIETRGNA